MRFLVALAIVLATSWAVELKSEKYRGNQVLRISVERREDMKWLHDIEDMLNLDFWTDPSLVRPVDVMVPRDLVREFKKMLDERALSYRVIKRDVQDDVDESYHEGIAALMKNDGRVGTEALADFDYTMYHTYDEIQQWVKDVAAKYNFVTRFVLGTTFENREIGALKIEASPIAGASDPKPVVYFEGGIHAREWISPATVMYFTGKLLENYINGDDDARRVLGMFELHIVPSLNCDGYVFTWQERLWRKSRKTNPDFGCVGTDLNRNWDAFWGMNGASPWPCSDVFRGFETLDNPETIAVDNHFKNLKQENRVTKVFIDWHSYSQLILAPWSYSSEAELPQETDVQVAAAAAMAAAMNATNSVNDGYIHGPSAQLLYEAAGASNDYGFASTPEATYSYVVELRDTGEYGFLLPADQIEPSGEESYNGVIALLDYVINNDY